jgi:hypothetical protein
VICSPVLHSTLVMSGWHRELGCSEDLRVLAVKDGYHEILGSQRLNLTFRRAT